LERLSPEQKARCDSVVTTGSAFDTIIGEAVACATDLIVIGQRCHHRRTAWARPAHP